MKLPPDRGHVATEQRLERHDASLDTLETVDLVRLLTVEQHHAISMVEAAAEAIASLADQVVEAMRSGGRLVYLGAGTSGRLGVLDASECPPTFGADPSQVIGVIAGGDAALRRSSEAREDDPEGATEELATLHVGAGDVVLGIAAGGTTPWVLGGLAAAKSRGAVTALLSCAPRALPDGVDQLIVLDTGAEVLTGSTRLKAGTATKVALNALTTSVFVRLGAVHGDLMVDVRATNAKLLDRAIRILQTYQPDLSRADVAAHIQQCEGHLKTAIVCACKNISPAEAASLLKAHAGHLRAALKLEE